MIWSICLEYVDLKYEVWPIGKYYIKQCMIWLIYLDNFDLTSRRHEEWWVRSLKSFQHDKTVQAFDLVQVLQLFVSRCFKWSEQLQPKTLGWWSYWCGLCSRWLLYPSFIIDNASLVDRCLKGAETNLCILV